MTSYSKMRLFVVLGSLLATPFLFVFSFIFSAEGVNYVLPMIFFPYFMLLVSLNNDQFTRPAFILGVPQYVLYGCVAAICLSKSKRTRAVGFVLASVLALLHIGIAFSLLWIEYV